MKRFKILPVAIVLVLMVAAVSCTPVRETGYDERVSTTPGRVYVDDPYRGTVILERDPYTGRYYEINSYDAYYGSRYRNYDPYYRDRYYHGNTRTTRPPRQYSQQPQTQPQQPTQEQIRQRQEAKDEARRKVLGNKS